MKQIRLFILFFLAICISLQAFAQASFTSKVSANLIGKSELLEVNYEVQNGEIEDFMVPVFTGWQVVGGPNVSSSTFISNGQRTVSMSYQYILKPMSTGSFTIPGAKATVNGKQMTSNSIKVVVDNKTHGSSATTPSAGMLPFFEPDPTPAPTEQLSEEYDGYLLREGEDVKQKTKNNLFILIEVSKKKCYEGEAIVANYQLYSRVNLNAHITRRPSFSGFSSIDLPGSNNEEFEIKEYKGKRFRVYNVRKVQLYPLLAGTQTLEPVEIEATVQYKKVPSARSMLTYDPYSPDNNVSIPYIVKSEPVSIDVLPFPTENKPANFTSVTGDFTITAGLRDHQLAKKQAGILRVEIDGSGNWSMLQTPDIKWPAGVEVFEPTVTEYLDSQKVPVTGKKIYDFPYSCADSGMVHIPPISFSYFDPVKEAYQTIRSQPLSVQVLNTTLPSSQPELLPDSQGDLTSIFTEVVKVAFPIIACLLVVWLVVKYRHKRRVDRLQQPWQKSQPVYTVKKEKEAWEEETNNRFMPVTGNYVPDPTPEESSPVYPSIQMDVTFPATPDIAPQASDVDTREFFGNIKAEINALLKTRWLIYDTSPASLMKQLEKKGMMSEDAESISMLLEACEKHIYSPFTESINSEEWKEIVAEIKFILEKKS